MANILIVGQKELLSKPTFEQDKNMLEIYNILAENNNIKVLYLHKNMLNNEENKNERNQFKDLQQFCIKDMIRKNFLRENLGKFIKDFNIETIVFASFEQAKFVMPYIEKFFNELNIICDFRFSRLNSCLQDYKDAKELRRKKNLNLMYKGFRVSLLHALPILKLSDSIILDKESDIELLENENIKNIITVEQLKDFVNRKQKNGINCKFGSFKSVDISISRNNYCSDVNFIESYKDDTKYNLNENKNINLIDSINYIIKNNTADCFFIHSDKIIFNKKILDLLISYSFVSDNIALASPNTLYSRDVSDFKSQFDNQRFGNFSFWEEASAISFSECVVIKKQFFHKIGFFDNKFKTFDYALFDFILRLYQIKAYCCFMHDISVFKPVKVKHQLSLMEQDKVYLCKKWGESNFNMAI